MLKIIVAIASYLMAAPFTSKISVNPMQTEWGSIWTYVIWAASALMCFAILTIALTLIVALIALYSDRR